MTSLGKSLLCLSVMLFSQMLFAQADRLTIEYPSAEWNNSPTAVDTAHIYVKKGGESRFVKVLVSESAPDSSLFTGDFSIDFASEQAVNSSAIEVYIPPTNERGSIESLQSFSKRVNSGEITQSPTLIKKTDKGYRLDVYDTQEQLNAAKQILEQERISKELADQKQKALEVARNDANQDAARFTDKTLQIAKAAAEASIKAKDRLRQQQLEAQRRALKQKRLADLEDSKKQDLKAKAEVLVERGRLAYKAGKFELAERYFKKAAEISPDDDRFYFVYGVALYRNEKLNEALVILKLAGKHKENGIERLYYMGLIHYRLSEFGPAADYFNAVKKANSPILSPSAAFYKGLALIGQEKLAEAKTEFEWVLDNSKDPKLDNRAEEYIEKIINLINYKKRIAQKWAVGAKAGLTYDSNILLSSDTVTSGTATNDGGLRVLAAGDVEYQFFVRDTYKWSTALDTLYLYSFDEEFNTADPWQTTLSLAYSGNGLNKKKQAFVFSIEPYLETLYMDVEDEGTRESILNSFGINLDYTLIRKKDFIVQYGAVIQKDNSLLKGVSEDDDADSMLYNINNSYTVFLDATKKRSVIAGLELWMNKATGENKNYNKFVVDATYVAPYKKWKDAIWTGGISAYKITYPDSDDSRKDLDVAFTGTLTKPLKNENWSITGVASYTSNTSNVEDYHYSKHTLMLLANYKWAQ